MSDLALCESMKCAAYILASKDGPTFPEMSTCIPESGVSLVLQQGVLAHFHLGLYSRWANDAITNFSTEHGHIIVQLR